MKDTLFLDCINILDWYDISYSKELIQQGSLLDNMAYLIQTKNPLFTRNVLYSYLHKPNYFISSDNSNTYVIRFKLDK